MSPGETINYIENSLRNPHNYSDVLNCSQKLLSNFALRIAERI